LFDFRLNEVAEWIVNMDASTVAVQLPEGLKVHAQSIARELRERTGADILILGDPCYGACDYAPSFSRYADALVQFGHAEIPSMASPSNVLFVEVFIDLDVTMLLERVLPMLRDRVGLLTTVQHVHQLPKIKEWLTSHGKEARIGRGDPRIKFEGQVLGCNISSVDPLLEEVDQFLYIGSGDFHPLMVAIESDKQVLVLDPLLNEVREIDHLKERILRQRHAAITRAETASRFLILVSTKVGQERMSLAMRLRRFAEENGRSADIVLLEEFHPDRLLPYQADAYVSTACPRIAIDDYLRYPKPILTPVELEIVLGRKKWTDYSLDSIQG
jgi:2-(3-amino-3-carboxypropyl)histidine synthase